MNEKTIRRPKGPAIIFLIQAITYFFTIFSNVFMTEVLDSPNAMPASGILRIVLFGVVNLFMSIVLFSKKYNNTLLVASGILLIPSVISLFSNITLYNISEIIFFLLLIAFTYIMVKMPDTPLREKTVKLRFIFPVFQFVFILISTIQTITELFEKLTQTMGTYPDGAMYTATILLPSILGAVGGFLPVLCYALLTNWLANPYEK